MNTACSCGCRWVYCSDCDATYPPESAHAAAAQHVVEAYYPVPATPLATPPSTVLCAHCQRPIFWATRPKLWIHHESHIAGCTA